MTSSSQRPAVLILDNGRIFHGFTYGSVGQAIGRLKFIPSQFDYQQTLTSQDNKSSIVVFAASHIGVTGWDGDIDQQIQVSGLVLRDPSRISSSWTTDLVLEDQLENQQVPAIQGVDTRALIRLIQSGQVSYGAISSDVANVSEITERLAAWVSEKGVANA